MSIADEVLSLIKNESEWEWEDYMNGTVGGFAKKLADAFNEADLKNLAKLADAFPQFYQAYAGYKGDVLKRLG